MECVDNGELFHFHEAPKPIVPSAVILHNTPDGRLMQMQTAMENEMSHVTLADIVFDIGEALQSLH